VRFGAIALARKPLIGVPAPVQGCPLQIGPIVAVPGPPGSPPTFESEAKTPAGVSAETNCASACHSVTRTRCGWRSEFVLTTSVFASRLRFRAGLVINEQNCAPAEIGRAIRDLMTLFRPQVIGTWSTGIACAVPRLRLRLAGKPSHCPHWGWSPQLP
jgi:hypothetical protein